MEWDLNKLISPADRAEIETAWQAACTQQGRESGGASWLCRLTHRWSKWWVSSAGPVMCESEDGEQKAIGEHVGQRRICLGCGRVELRQAWSV